MRFQPIVIFTAVVISLSSNKVNCQQLLGDDANFKVIDAPDPNLFKSGFYSETGHHQSKEHHLLNMLQWMSSLGGELNKIEMREFQLGNIGMMASEDITRGDLIAYIPKEMLMTEEDAYKYSRYFYEL